jgi:hypothetical protein
MRVLRILLVLPLLFLVIACSGESPEPASAPVPDERAALKAVTEINQAQGDYMRRTRRYAQSFNELIAERLLESEPAEDKIGYKFSLYPSPDAGSYTLKATPSSVGARHFFSDQTGVIRAEGDKPATVDSPTVTE